MRIFKTRGRLVVLTSLAMWGALYACSVEDENPGSPRSRTGDSGSEGSVDPNGGDAPFGAPLCGKYGGYDKVKTMAAAIVARVSGDCRISAPIASLQGGDAIHFNECFQIYVGSAFQCPGITYVGGTTLDSNKQRCRSMANAHQGLNLRKADFDAFVEDIASELTAQGLSTDDLRAIAPAFEGARTGVVQTNNQPDKNTHCSCPDGLYMGEECKPIVIDAGNDGGNDGGNDAGNDASLDAPTDG